MLQTKFWKNETIRPVHNAGTYGKLIPLRSDT